MEDYNKIIESLGVKFVKDSRIGILNSVQNDNYYNVENSIILLEKGEISFRQSKNDGTLKPGDVLFIPSGKLTSIKYGSGKPAVLNNDELSQNMEKYFIPVEETESTEASFLYLTFKANVFDSVNFFQSLDVPTFIIKKHDKLNEIIWEVISESDSNHAGKDRIIKLNTERIVIEIIRYILDNKLFVEQLATNVTYFKDPRLLDIFQFINDNLEGDLSNKVLANVANVSEDYVGQYFKMLTGINPQDYIEYQRMEKAVHLLRTSKKSIREIGRDVGYKDTAYFCRRFKMMFGIPAGKMRRRESLMNI